MEARVWGSLLLESKDKVSHVKRSATHSSAVVVSEALLVDS